MKVKRSRGNAVITKIEIAGFPIDINISNEHAAHWWRPIGKELKRHAAALYERAVQTFREQAMADGSEIPTSVFPTADPGPPRPEAELSEEWLDPVFPCLVCSAPETVASLPPTKD
jgi:hypothetical protein